MVAIAEAKQIAGQLNQILPILREINNEQQHEQALELMDELIEDYDTNLVLIEALGNAITRYEEQAGSFADFNQRNDDLDPAVAMLRVLMDQHGLNTMDFEKEVGKKSMVSQVLNGHKKLTREHISNLCKRFAISPALFF